MTDPVRHGRGAAVDPALVLFDLDGTLVDSEPGIAASAAYALARFGLPAPTRQALRAWIGPPLRESFAAVFGAGDPRVEAAVAAYRERYVATGWRELSVYPGIAETIAALRAGGSRLAVVTTKIEDQARRIVAHLPFGAAFEAVYGAPPGTISGDKSARIARALEDFGVAAGACAMVGDRHFDMLGARANAVRAIGAAWGFGSVEELREAGADAIAAHPDQLLPLLTQPRAA
ncbi:MAG: HAD family hydrolase [Rhodanobacter denitrificans]|uniref:HAD family hydrolase n=1 Tax=Rhodanobacter denitrificans TaxID=666685 RepID=A0A2W5K8N0_9GAMM|nr:MAG: HAD family hydrolase [Rhodanobacter denitrificans]